MASPSRTRSSAHQSNHNSSQNTSTEISPRSSRVSKERRCQYCDKAFSKTEHLVRHERGHTKERPFRCEVCGRTYGRHDTLLRHAKGHTHEKKSSGLPGASCLDFNVTPSNGLHSSDRNQETVDVNLPTNQPSVRRVDNGSLGQMDGVFAGATNLEFHRTNEMREQPELDSSQLQEALGQGAVEQTSYLTGNFSTGSFEGSHTSPFSDANLWGASWMSPGPSWLAGFDFDLEALNTSVLATIDASQPPPLFQPPQNSSNIDFNTEGSDTAQQAESQKKQRFMDDVMKMSWFTRVRNVDSDDEYGRYTSGRNTPTIATERYDVDESFRDRVSQKLKPKPNHHPLPPANFLSLSVQVYFSKFNALFPILHSHTFRPNPKNSLLLLSVCSIGSLLIGSKGAAAQGARIFETLNKAILASWENTVLSKDASETAAMVQASLIGQTFGMLSGEPKHLAIVDCFHGTVVSLARKCNMFNHRTYRPRLETISSGSELNNEWKTWARSEEVNRAVLGLYIHDAAISSMFQHEALLRSEGISLPVAADDELFNAPTAAEWRERMLLRMKQLPSIHKCMHVNLPPHQYTEPLPEELSCKSSRLTAYVILCGILTSICEKQQMDQLEPGSSYFEKYFEALMCWYFTFQFDHEKEPIQIDPLCLMILWHTAFMNLLANFNILERAIGREGSQTSSAESDHLYVATWASSTEAKRCILHVHAIQNILGMMRLDAEPAIHIPHCLFLAGVASFCYAQFGRSPDPAPNVNLDFPEFMLRGVSVPQHLFKSSLAASDPGTVNVSNRAHTPGPVVPVGTAMLYMLTDMLQRIGHWGIARKLSGVLGALVQADSDELWAPP